jgi:hypothetical protein
MSQGALARIVVAKILNERMAATDHLSAAEPLQAAIGRVRAAFNWP